MRRRIINISITIILSLIFILLAIFCYSSSYVRLGESLGDLVYAIKNFISYVFGSGEIQEDKVGQMSEVLQTPSFMPKENKEFNNGIARYFNLVFSKDIFLAYLIFLLEKIFVIFRVLLVVIPIIILLIMLIKRIYSTVNNNYGRDTLPLKCFKFIEKYTYYLIKRIVVDYINFIRNHGWIKVCWIIIWVLSLNLMSIIFSLVTFYLNFVITYDLGLIYKQLVIIVTDLQVWYNAFTLVAVIILVLIIFSNYRRKIALNRLRRFEARNCGFINELPIVTMTVGSMGKKKTTIITDMSLSQEKMFRQKALDILIENDTKFPYFPWICFEKEIEKLIEEGSIYNLATIKDFVENKRRLFEENYDRRHLYGYDVNRYGCCFDDALKVLDIFDVLKTYGQAYFIYIIETSLILSNYSIRTDNQLVTEGNLPFWAMDFFPKDTRTGGRHSHILDFDILRLGKKVKENNPNAGSFEFGVVTITEIGKERGNNLELKELKKGTEETNQKNDLFNSWLKMCRHSSTVDNYPFIKVFTDEQRPESWGADARDLCDIIHINGGTETRLALPFYTIEEMVTEWLFVRFMNIYTDFRYKRGDNTLFIYILKKITCALYNRHRRIYNKYGYNINFVELEKGTRDSKKRKKKYYLMNKKIYSNRFSTDCFSDYFNELARNSNVGINDYLEYEKEKATVQELKEQNSYFVSSLYK